MAGTLPGARRGLEQIFPHSLDKGTNPPTPLDFQPSGLRQYIPPVKSLLCGALLWQPSQADTAYIIFVSISLLPTHYCLFPTRTLLNSSQLPAPLLALGRRVSSLAPAAFQTGSCSEFHVASSLPYFRSSCHRCLY